MLQGEQQRIIFNAYAKANLGISRWVYQLVLRLILICSRLPLVDPLIIIQERCLLIVLRSHSDVSFLDLRFIFVYITRRIFSKCLKRILRWTTAVNMPA